MRQVRLLAAAGAAAVLALLLRGAPVSPPTPGPRRRVASRTRPMALVLSRGRVRPVARSPPARRRRRAAAARRGRREGRPDLPAGARRPGRRERARRRRPPPRDRAAWIAARIAYKRLTGTRRAELGAVLANADRDRARRRADPLARARAGADARAQPRSGGRPGRCSRPTSASGSPAAALVWEYYPGQGIEIQWLGTFGAANGLADQRNWSGADRAARRGARPRRGARRRHRLGVRLRLRRRRAAVGQRRSRRAPRSRRSPRPARRLRTRRCSPPRTSALGIFTVAPPVGVRSATTAGARYLIYSFAPHEFVINAFIQSLVGLFDLAKHRRLARHDAVPRRQRPGAARPAPLQHGRLVALRPVLGVVAELPPAADGLPAEPLRAHARDRSRRARDPRHGAPGQDRPAPPGRPPRRARAGRPARAARAATGATATGGTVYRRDRDHRGDRDDRDDRDRPASPASTGPTGDDGPTGVDGPTGSTGATGPPDRPERPLLHDGRGLQVGPHAAAGAPHRAAGDEPRDPPSRTSSVTRLEGLERRLRRRLRGPRRCRRRRSSWARGTHLLTWRPPHAGAWTVTLAAVDLAGNRAPGRGRR